MPPPSELAIRASFTARSPAFGQDGPRRNEPGHDLNAQALTGAAWLARDAQGRPQGLPLPIADLSASMAAVSSICAALYRREQTGEGDYLDVAMVDTVLSWTHLWSSGVDLAGAAQEHIPPSLEPLARRALTERLDRERLRALPHYTTYPCRDGEWIALGIVDERKFWVALCEVLGIRRFSGLSIPMRAALSPVLKPILRWLIRRHPRDYWLERMGAADLPVTPVLSPRDALQDVHIASRLVKGEDLRAPLAGSSFVEGPAPDGTERCAILTRLSECVATEPCPMFARLLAPSSILLIAVVGCNGDRLGGPTGETGFEAPTCRMVYEGPVQIEEASVTCLSDNRVRFFVETRGWTSSVTVFSQETGNPGTQWADQHDLTTFKFGQCQDFDQLQQELVTGVDQSVWEPNVSTRFSCEQSDDKSFVHHGDPEDGGIMTYLVRAYATDGTLADCMVFGHDPVALVEGTADRVVDPERPEELENCVVGEYTKEST